MQTYGTWYQHPLTLFLAPLITLLCLPQLYRFLPFNIDPAYDDRKLQEIAGLMDNIYATLADLTFIPHNAITRGPHKINATALSCKPSRSVLRLIELLPYVDISLVQEPDWIYGGYFMDYRNPEHLAELCDPLRGESINWTDYMEPSDVALTNWGTGGWNNDNTWVLLYNAEMDSIRIYNGELWVERRAAKREFGEYMDDWWFEDNGQLVWDMHGGATHILRAVSNKFKDLHWTPWGTSNREDGFGIDYNLMPTLLQRNGWPEAFLSAHFNADFIRAQHKPFDKGYAKAALKRIDELAGFNRSVADGDFTWIDSDKGQIRWIEERGLRDRKAFETEADDEERALLEYKYLSMTWLAEHYQEELEAVQLKAARLCPNGVCVEEADLILWEYLSLQRAQEETQYSNFTRDCEYHLQEEPSNDPDHLERCVVNKATERTWLELAVKQSHDEAVAHCKETSCELLPFKNVFDRAQEKIAEYERYIERSIAHRNKVEARVLEQLPGLGAKAREQMEADNAAMCSSEFYLEEDIKSIQEQVARLRRGEELNKVHKGLFDHVREVW